MDSFTDGIMIGGGAVTTLAGLVCAWLRSRASRAALREHARDTAIPQPCTVEQSAFQAHCKDNAKDHTDIFDRLRRVEADVAGHTAAILAIKETNNRIYEMVSKLYDKICGGKRK